MKPSVGRIVIYRQPEHEISVNGINEHPALITRVWSPTCVNLQVLYDAAPVGCRTSVVQLPELPAGVENTSGAAGWRWPDRV